MATKVIDRNEARLPFFGDKMSFVTGLDPLGLQNPSVEMYSYLLPGLNNVTSRIRNYSFYCWLLAEYAKQIESADPKAQRRFIRKAEYIVALVAVKAGIQGISGSLYASNRLKENPASFNLDSGTYNSDGSTVNTYWQYGSGIFGQYYVGSLRQIGLIEEPINDRGEALGIYRRTSRQDQLKVSGEELAEAFDENITPSNKQLFFQCLYQGTINHEQLQQLADDFNLTQLKPDSNEPTLLINLLLDIDVPSVLKDHPKSMRRQTLIHVLRYVYNHGTSLDSRAFSMYAYDVRGLYDNVVDDSLSGWYYYQLNEYWQLGCTAIFNGALDYLYELKGPGWMSLNDLIKEATNAVVSSLINEGTIKEETDVIAAALAELDDEKELTLNINKGRNVSRMTNGFKMIWKLYDRNREDLARLKDFAKSRGIGGNDDVLSFFLAFEKNLERSTSDFIEHFLLKKIVHRHQHVAYRKMGGGAQSTQKFIIEDNYIRRIGNFAPGFTSPRIGNLIAFLQDLKLLDSDNKLTEAGSLLLIQHS